MTEEGISVDIGPGMLWDCPGCESEHQLQRLDDLEVDLQGRDGEELAVVCPRTGEDDDPDMVYPIGTVEEVKLRAAVQTEIWYAENEAPAKQVMEGFGADANEE